MGGVGATAITGTWRVAERKSIGKRFLRGGGAKGKAKHKGNSRSLQTSDTLGEARNGVPRQGSMPKKVSERGGGEEGLVSLREAVNEP